MIGASQVKDMCGLEYLQAMIDGRIPPPPIAKLMGFDIRLGRGRQGRVHGRSARVALQPDRHRARRPGLHAARLGGRMRGPDDAPEGAWRTPRSRSR